MALPKGARKIAGTENFYAAPAGPGGFSRDIYFFDGQYLGRATKNTARLEVGYTVRAGQSRVALNGEVPQNLAEAAFVLASFAEDGPR